MTFHPQLFHPSTIKALAMLSDPEQYVACELVTGKCPNALDNFICQHPPKKLDRYRVAPSFTFDLRSGVILKLDMMVSLTANEDGIIIAMGFLSHCTWDSVVMFAEQVNLSREDIELSPDKKYLAAEYWSTTRDGRLRMSRELHGVLCRIHHDLIDIRINKITIPPDAQGV